MNNPIFISFIALAYGIIMFLLGMSLHHDHYIYHIELKDGPDPLLHAGKDTCEEAYGMNSGGKIVSAGYRICSDPEGNIRMADSGWPKLYWDDQAGFKIGISGTTTLHLSSSTKADVTDDLIRYCKRIK